MSRDHVTFRSMRALQRRRVGGALVRAMAALNARHPWSHNDAFHPWVLSRLPAGRGLAVDVGCGRGELVAALAPRFERVHGTDRDPGMRLAASRRCAGLGNVIIDDADLADLPYADADLVTMIAVLHHLELRPALREVRRILRPGGRFLCVGLAVTRSPADRAWELVSSVTNPLIGLVRHPWVSRDDVDLAPCPVRDPELSLAEIRAGVDDVMPGAAVRQHLAFRHTIAWEAPKGP